MADARKSGIALIVGSMAMVITMAIHPRGHVTTADEAENMARMLIAVHSLALASVPVIFLGTWGLSRRLDAPDRVAMAGLVIYTFALIAVTNAAVFDGLVAPNIIRQIVGAAAEKKDAWQVAMRLNFEMNQAYARLYAAASGVAILLWSVVIVRKGQLSRAVGIYGCILGLAIVGAVGSGLLNPNVHGFGALIFAEAAWFIVVGLQLRSAVQA